MIPKPFVPQYPKMIEKFFIPYPQDLLEIIREYIAGLFHPSRNSQQYPEHHTQYRCKQHPHFSRQEECDGVCRYQKKGIVFLKTKFHCASQFRCVMMRVIGIGVRSCEANRHNPGYAYP